jgi:hypothetical protein
MSNVELLMTRQAVADYLGLTLETIKTYRREGVMPVEDVLYERTPLWRKSTIDNWRNK